ncbi:MAG: tetratricopeptide repeat protein [Bacteroidetes bacterium]|nr:tetratricopeptide repeat protein [Bacteroidota bacterium]
MRYVPDLIPDKSKVLRDYFKGDIYEPRQPNQPLTVLGWIFGVFFLIGAFVSIKHPALTLVFGLLSFILLPPGHRWIERKFRFRLTTKVKSILGAALFISAMPLTGHYSEIDKQEAYQEKVKTEQEQKEKAAADKKEQERKDSLDFHLQASNKFAKDHNTDEATKQLTYALAFVSTQADKDQISKEQIGISAIKTFDLVKAGKYQTALPELNNLIAQDGNNSNLLYNRAICYSKTGKIQEAVTDCKAAIALGNTDAEKLHDKINPIRKRVAYYVTRCCDGSTSSSKGRGACSRHGGVCDWNEPVYEEYRKYE